MSFGHRRASGAARKPKARLFPIAGQGDEFVSGVCAHGPQVVMGLLLPDLTAVLCDANGDLC
jgi:hypothetical protein